MYNTSGYPFDVAVQNAWRQARAERRAKKIARLRTLLGR
jgi:hypothetical protein